MLPHKLCKKCKVNQDTTFQSIKLAKMLVWNIWCWQGYGSQAYIAEWYKLTHFQENILARYFKSLKYVSFWSKKSISEDLA